MTNLFEQKKYNISALLCKNKFFFCCKLTTRYLCYILYRNCCSGTPTCKEFSSYTESSLMPNCIYGLPSSSNMVRDALHKEYVRKTWQFKK